jgi:hypothetical protein
MIEIIQTKANYLMVLFSAQESASKEIMSPNPKSEIIS